MEPTSRACTKCALVKSLDEFSKAPRGKYGRKASCKDCDAARYQTNHVPAVVDEDAKRVRYTSRQLGQRSCNKCGIIKPRSQFSMVRNGKYAPILKSHCKECQATAARQWYADNTERARESKRRFNLEKFYSLTIAEYDDLLTAQGGVCAICGRDEPNEHGRTGQKFRLSVDHCHDSGAVRGLLCQRCNRAMGLFGDDPELLQKTIEYLLQSKKGAIHRGGQ